jgi:RNA 3'-terminal phosphate cyclase
MIDVLILSSNVAFGFRWSVGKKAETVGDEAAEELIKNIHLGGCCDEYPFKFQTLLEKE